MNRNETYAQVEAVRRLTPPARHCMWLRSLITFFKTVHWCHYFT